LLQHLSKMESLPQFSGWRTPGVCAGEILVDHEPESDEDGGDIGEVGDMEDRTLSDAAMEDEIADQLFELDTLHPDSVPYKF
jgi:hypothetical protein